MPSARPGSAFPAMSRLSGSITLKWPRSVGRPRQHEPVRAGFVDSSALVLHRFVRDIEALVDDGEGFAQLLFIDAEWRVRIESVPAHQRVEALLAEKAAQSGHLFGCAVEWRHGL